MIQTIIHHMTTSPWTSVPTSNHAWPGEKETSSKLSLRWIGANLGSWQKDWNLVGSIYLGFASSKELSGSDLDLSRTRGNFLRFGEFERLLILFSYFALSFSTCGSSFGRGVNGGSSIRSPCVRFLHSVFIIAVVYVVDYFPCRLDWILFINCVDLWHVDDQK